MAALRLLMFVRGMSVDQWYHAVVGESPGQTEVVKGAILSDHQAS